MEGYRFLVCCVLVIYKLEGATASVTYQFNPIIKSKNDIATSLQINFVLLPEHQDKMDDKTKVIFTVTALDKALTITTSDKPVTADLVSVRPGGMIVYGGNFEVHVTTHTDGVLTGDLSAELYMSCDHKLCKGNDQSVVIVKETKTLNVTATATHTVSQATASVTVTLSKDLATSDDITISVSLHDPQGQDYSSEGVLVSDADSSIDVVFPDIQWGEYQLIIGCGDDSVCSTLSQWIHFPEPVSVPAHPSYSEQAKTILDLQKKVASLSDTVLHGPPGPAGPAGPAGDGTTATSATSATSAGTTTNATTATTATSATNATSAGTTASADPAPGDPGAPTITTTTTTHHMVFAVGGLIAVLVCGLLAYLIYHYRTMLKEWICSKTGSKYTKLPLTIQVALPHN